MGCLESKNSKVQLLTKKIKNNKQQQIFAQLSQSVEEQICEQVSYTLHHINRAKLFTVNSATSRLRDILRDWGKLSPAAYANT